MTTSLCYLGKNSKFAGLSLPFPLPPLSRHHYMVTAYFLPEPAVVLDSVAELQASTTLGQHQASLNVTYFYVLFVALSTLGKPWQKKWIAAGFLNCLSDKVHYSELS